MNDFRDQGISDPLSGVWGIFLEQNDGQNRHDTTRVSIELPKRKKTPVESSDGGCTSNTNARVHSRNGDDEGNTRNPD